MSEDISGGFLSLKMTNGFIGTVDAQDNKPPARGYVHSTGIEVYDNYVKAAEAHFKQVLKEHRAEFLKFQYILAALWGNNGDRYMDMFGYSGITQWPGNPDMRAWVMQNGIFVQRNEIFSRAPSTCGDTVLFLGIEEDHRRHRKSLEDYISTPPPVHSTGQGTIMITALK